MKIYFSIDYKTEWGQILYITGSTHELGNWDKSNAVSMKYISNSRWGIEMDIVDNEPIYYKYILKKADEVIREEFQTHSLKDISSQHSYYINDIWLDMPKHNFLYSSAFTECFFKQEPSSSNLKYFDNTLLIKVTCPYVRQNQILLISGDNNYLGNWDVRKALNLTPMENGEWLIVLDIEKFDSDTAYKFAIYDKDKDEIIHWDEGYNRCINPFKSSEKVIKVISVIYNCNNTDWYGAGISIPVFSLKSKDSFGIGDFHDLKKMIDWAKLTGLKIIQILPINDTTSCHTWKDSYPYNAISIYALHPIYLGFTDYPLKDENKRKKYEKEAEFLNNLEKVDYESVSKCKLAYLKDLYDEIGEEVFNEADYHQFYHKNESWLYPYAFFCYLRDQYESFEIDEWRKYRIYNKAELDTLICDPQIRYLIKFQYFIQYLLHKQLVSVKKYAHQNGVILKGDIPIGISRNSVEAWIEPHLFNLDTQTGAPPDAFSSEGQNWGFPTYNWDEMEKDGYSWWIKRFQKMADYFDAYRIDHILGFFRIWEIPENAVQGVLGYFNPALPFSLEELQNSGLDFDEYRMVKPYIHETFLSEIFGDYTQEVIEKFIHPIGNNLYELNSEYDTQRKIKLQFANRIDELNIYIRNGLYYLCGNVLFIRDKYNPHLLHPRIEAQNTHTYKYLDDKDKNIFDSLYNDFFYHRHNQFWHENAIKKLPALISSTQMLVCGEDLGMIPDCVHPVLSDLQILTLEIERMPKDPNRMFSDLRALPYISVCTTSTHDMSPIRAWWCEDKSLIQKYYNEVLWKQGIAPSDCTSDICIQIIKNHLNASSMLTIIPLQDWLSINDKYKRKNPEDERINIPAIPDYYWQYRMHLFLENLVIANDLNETIRNMIYKSHRD